jgi:hypothetical protein
MCKIPERNATKMENIFMIDRNGRQLLNWNDLCALPEMAKYEVRTKCFENMNFCDQVRSIYWGDIILAPHGSGIALATFARFAKIANNVDFFRKGSVLVDIVPKKFRNPDLKLIMYYSSVRYLEFTNMNDSRTGQIIHPDPKYRPRQPCEVFFFISVPTSKQNRRPMFQFTQFLTRVTGIVSIGFKITTRFGFPIILSIIWLMPKDCGTIQMNFRSVNCLVLQCKNLFGVD